MLVGDFNVARYNDEKVGGRFLSIQQLQDFNDFIDSCALSDKKSSGGKWSWHNKTVGTKRIAGRLDRVLCNIAWINSFQDFTMNISLTHPLITLQYICICWRSNRLARNLLNSFITG